MEAAYSQQKDIQLKWGEVKFEQNTEPKYNRDYIKTPVIGVRNGFDRYEKEIFCYFEYNGKSQTTLKVIILMSL
jgi:hypothetical protein